MKKEFTTLDTRPGEVTCSRSCGQQAAEYLNPGLHHKACTVFFLKFYCDEIRTSYKSPIYEYNSMVFTIFTDIGNHRNGLF